MSIVDKNLVFSGTYASGAWTGQSIVGTAATAINGTNVIDLGDTTQNTLKDIGMGRDLYLVIFIKVAVAATGGASNVTFKLVSDDNTSLTSPTTHWTSGAIAKGTLAAGYLVAKVSLPVGKTYERYLGVTYTPDTNDTTSGTAVALLTTNPDAWVGYAKNYTIIA